MKLYTTFIALIFIASSAHAGTELNTGRSDAPKMTANYLSDSKLEKHQETIQRLHNYLDSIVTMVADFTQTAPDGTLSTGKFYMQRPGKMRWEYAPPTPVLIVSNGSELVYFDKELEQVSTVPLSSTLGGFLAEDEIRFNGPIGIEEVSNEAGVIRITISQREKQDEGKLTLEFSDNPLVLRNLITRDAANMVTYVALSDIKMGGKLSRELFIFRDPRKKKR